MCFIHLICRALSRIEFPIIALATMIILATAAHADAQCTLGWKPGEGIPGINGAVYAVTTWDPDGPGGPQQPLMVVGGSFTIAGNVLANNVAAWDGTGWQSLGVGTNSTIFALTEFSGELIAGGDFTSAGGVAASRIGTWDGSSWHPLGSGMNSTVRALAVFNGALIAGVISISPVKSVQMELLAGTSHLGIRWGQVLPEHFHLCRI